MTRRQTLAAFLDELKKQDELLKAFDPLLWNSLIEHVTVNSADSICNAENFSPSFISVHFVAKIGALCLTAYSCKTGYGQLLVGPIGWADKWTTDLPAV